MNFSKLLRSGAQAAQRHTGAPASDTATERDCDGIVADAAVRQRRNEESLGTYLGFGMRRPARKTTLVMEAHRILGPALERST